MIGRGPLSATGKPLKTANNPEGLWLF